MSSKISILIVFLIFLSYVKIDVFKGNFDPPDLKAEIAVLLFTPHNSNIKDPPETLLDQKLIEPFPLPILDSIGFLVIGEHGNNLIHNLPFLLILFTMDCLADYSCFEEM